MRATLLLVVAACGRYGQRIAARAVVSLRTGAARPRLAVTAGLQVVGVDGISVRSRDVASFTVECAQVPRDKLIAVLAGGELPARPRIAHAAITIARVERTCGLHGCDDRDDAAPCRVGSPRAQADRVGDDDDVVLSRRHAGSDAARSAGAARDP